MSKYKAGVLLAAISLFNSAHSYDDSSRLIVENLVGSDCSSFLYAGINRTEFSAAITISQECAERYFRNRVEFIKEEELPYIIVQLVASKYANLVVDVFSYSIENFSKEIVDLVIHEAFSYGFDIELFRSIYEKDVGDFDIIKSAIIKVYE
jgi:hypothetical protein